MSPGDAGPIPLGEYLVGAAYLGLIVGAVVLTAGLIVRRRLEHLVGVPRRLAFSLLATAGILLVHIVPGALAILSREAVLVTAVLLLLVATRVPRVGLPQPDDNRPPLSGSTVSWVLALLAGAAVVLYVIAMARDRYGIAPTQIDTLTFHLPDVAKWIQTGTLWRVDEFVPSFRADQILPNYAYAGNYPHNGNVIQLAVTLPWRDDFAAHLTPYPFLILAVLAVYALGCELGAPRPASIIFACTVMTIPAIAHRALLDGFPEAVLLATFPSGLLFLLRHARTGRTSDLVLAGLGLGIAFGTKWYGVSSVPAVVLVWLLASLVARRPTTQVLRQASVLTGMIALAGGFWLVRNWVVSGNPVFPVDLAPLGVRIFDGVPGVTRANNGFALAHYLGEPGTWWNVLLPQFRHALAGPAMVLAMASLVALGVTLVHRRRDASRNRVFIVVAALTSLLVLVVIYLVTPFSALGPDGAPWGAWVNTRYLGPALCLAAALGAWAAGQLGRWGVLLEVGAAAALVDGMIQSTLPSFTGWATAVAAGVVAGLVVIAATQRHLIPEWRQHHLGAAAALAALLAAVIAVEYRGQKLVIDGRYRGQDPTVDWILANAPSGHRVGLAGVWNGDGISPVRPAFGDREGNHVEFVGRAVRELLLAYPDRSSFARALGEGNYDLLVVGRAEAFPAPMAREERWAQAVGFKRVTQSGRLALYRLGEGRTERAVGRGPTARR